MNGLDGVGKIISTKGDTSLQYFLRLIEGEFFSLIQKDFQTTY